MRAFSNDLRERIVAAVGRGGHTLQQLAALFMVDVSVIVRLRQRQRQTGSIDPKPNGGGRPANWTRPRRSACSNSSANNRMLRWRNSDNGWALPVV